MLALALAFVLFQAAQPQQTSPQMGTPKPLTDSKIEKCTIEGKVSSAVDGAPLKKAAVTLFPQSQAGAIMRPATTTTDGEGKFLFPDLDAARYTMSVSRNGYARQNYGARVPNGPGTVLALIAGQHLTDISVRLVPGAAINGRIVDEDNEPVASVSVSAVRWSYMMGKRQLVPFGSGSTDDRGQYRIYGLPPGRYFVSANSRNSFVVPINAAVNTKESEDSYAATYYPGTLDSSQAAMVEVKPGDDIAGIVFRLMRARAVRVSGVVRGPDGEPLKNAMVQIVSRSQASFPTMNMQINMTDDKGVFAIPGIMPGAYMVIARGAMDQQQVFGRADIDVANAPLENVVVQAGNGVEVEADVHLDGAVDLSKSTVRLALASEDVISFTPSSAAEIKDAGTVTLAKVYDGAYVVRAFPLPDDAYVSKAVYDDNDVLEQGIKIHGSGGHLDVTISAAGSHVEGTVFDKGHQPFAGAQVVLVPEESRRSHRDLFRNASSDQYGHFVLRGVPPGTYKLYAWESVDPGAYMDPDFLKSYEDQGKSISLTEGQHSTPELTIIPSAKTGE